MKKPKKKLVRLFKKIVNKKLSNSDNKKKIDILKML